VLGCAIFHSPGVKEKRRYCPLVAGSASSA
jgi:hypothetical protein